MRRWCWSVVVIALVGAGCTRTGEAGTTTTAVIPPPLTTTTTAPTTTAVAGLGSRVLGFGLEAGRLDKYDATYTYTTDMKVAGSLPEDADVGGFSTVTIDGRLWRLILPGPIDGTFEVIEDFRPDSGRIVFTDENGTATQDLIQYDLDSYGGILGAYVIDDTGRKSDRLGGTPGYFTLNPTVSDPLSSLGPVLPDDPLGVGDRWTTAASVPLMGEVAVEASVAAEDRIDGVATYGIEYTASAQRLPITLTLEDATALLGANLTASGQIAALADLRGDLSIRLTDYSVDAGYHLDPEGGVIVDSEVGTAITMALALTVPEGTLIVTAAVSVSTDATLVESAPAEGFESTGVLDRMAPDPFRIAVRPLAALSGYTFEPVEDLAGVQDLSDAVLATRQDIFAGYAFTWVVDEAGERILVASVANSGPYRGAPQLSETLAEYWSGATPTTVTVAGRTAYRATVNDVEWLLWNSDTHLFVLIGPDAASTRLLQALMEQPPPYRWRAGDCLDFRDELESGRPYAPFGEVGLVHCSAEHTFEVIFSEPMPEGADAPYPDDIEDRSLAACDQAYVDYTGSNDQLTSLIAMVNYLPDPTEWERGSRYLACGIYLIDEQGTATVTGRLEGSPHEHHIDVGVGLCQNKGYPVECTAPHTTEVIAELTYPAEPGDPYPDTLEVAQGMCDAALVEYGPTSQFNRGVVVDPVFHSPATWLEGERAFFCLASAVGDTGPIVVVGPFDGSWQEFAGGGAA